MSKKPCADVIRATRLAWKAGGETGLTGADFRLAVVGHDIAGTWEDRRQPSSTGPMSHRSWGGSHSVDGVGAADADLGAQFIRCVQSYAILTLDEVGRVMSWNAGAERIKGYRAEEIIGRPFEVFYTPEDVDRGQPHRHLADAATRGRLQYEGWRVRADGSRFWADVDLTAIYDARRELRGFGKITRDSTASRRFQKELMRRALHDPLTGLPNRALLLDRLRKALARLERHPETVAVFFIDLDRFKTINDTYGHQAGDRVLVTVAERLRSVLRTQDTVARLSGDEFVVVCEGLNADMTAAIIAQRLAAALTAPVVLPDACVSVWASIGVVVTQRPDQEPETLLRDADTAMYHAKTDRNSQRDPVRIFDPTPQSGGARPRPDLGH